MCDNTWPLLAFTPRRTNFRVKNEIPVCRYYVIKTNLDLGNHKCKQIVDGFACSESVDFIIIKPSLNFVLIIRYVQYAYVSMTKKLYKLQVNVISKLGLNILYNFILSTLKICRQM